MAINKHTNKPTPSARKASEEWVDVAEALGTSQTGFLGRSRLEGREATIGIRVESAGKSMKLRISVSRETLKEAGMRADDKVTVRWDQATFEKLRLERADKNTRGRAYMISPTVKQSPNTSSGFVQVYIRAEPPKDFKAIIGAKTEVVNVDDYDGAIVIAVPEDVATVMLDLKAQRDRNRLESEDIESQQ